MKKFLSFVFGFVFLLTFAFIGGKEIYAQNTIPLSSCGNLANPGTYTVIQNLSTNGACLQIINAKDITINCQGKQINGAPSFKIENSENIKFESCTFDSTISSFASANKVSKSKNITFIKNTFNSKQVDDTYTIRIDDSSNSSFLENTVYGKYEQYYSKNMIIKDNKFTFPKTNKLIIGVINLIHSSGSQAINNFIDGNSDTRQTSVGVDDGIYISGETGGVFSNNNIKNVWDCGIETTNPINNSKFENNTIKNTGICGIGGWYTNSLTNNVFNNNFIDDSPKAFDFYRAYGLNEWYDGISGQMVRENKIYFNNNTFSGNTFINPRNSTYSSNFSVEPISSGLVAGQRIITANDIVTGNNVFKNNNFGTVSAPFFSPTLSVTDGGGNVCDQARTQAYYPPNYPIKCQTTSFPVVTQSCPTGTNGTYPNCVPTTVSTPKPTVNLTANPTSVSSGGSTTLSWTSTNAISCTASANPINTNWTGAKGTSGSQTISNLTQSTSFSITCTGQGGSVSANLSVSVLSNPIPGCPSGTTGTYPDCFYPSSCLELSNDLKFGDKNNEVTKLQTFLKSKGYFTENPTGFFGTVTENAVISFQKANNITPAAGYVGSITRAKIKALTCTETPVCPEGYSGIYPNCKSVDYAQPNFPYPNIQVTTHKISSGDSTTLTWTTGHASSCTASSNPANSQWAGNKEVKGTQIISNLTQTTTFNITCNGFGGSDGKGETQTYSVTIEVSPLTNSCPSGTTGTYPNCITPNTTSSCVELSIDLKYGDKNNEVTKLQTFLKSKGYFTENPTGFFGTVTENAVIAFQKANNISPAAGYVGSITRAKINELNCVGSDTTTNNTTSVKVVYPNGGESFKPLDVVIAKVQINIQEDLLTKISLAYYPTKNSKPLLLNAGDFPLNGNCGIEKSTTGYDLNQGYGDVDEITKEVAFDFETCNIWGAGISTDAINFIVPPLSLILNKNNLEISDNNDNYLSANSEKRLHLYDFSGKKFKLLIQLQDKNSKIISEDYSDDFFSIFPEGVIEGCVPGVNYTNSSTKCPSIVLNTPNEAKVYKAGDKIDISWTAKNAPKNSWVALSFEDQDTKIKYFISAFLPVTEKISYFFPKNIKKEGFNTITEGQVYEKLLNKNLKVVAELYLGNFGSDNFSGSFSYSLYGDLGDYATRKSYNDALFPSSRFSFLSPHLLASDSSDGILKMNDQININSCPFGTTGTYPNCVTNITPKPTVTLTANPTSVSLGGSTSLTWTSTNTTSCTAGSTPSNTNWTGTKSISGNQTLSNLQSTATYTLTCSNQSGEKVSKSVDVGVLSKPIEEAKPTISILNPIIKGDGTDVVLPNQTVEVKWETKNVKNNLIAIGLVYNKKLEGDLWQKDFAIIKNDLSNNGVNSFKIPSITELKSLNLKNNYFTIGAFVRPEGINPPLASLAATETKSFFINIPCDAGQTGSYPNCVTGIQKPTVNLTLSKNKIIPGESITVTWNSDYVTSCEANSPYFKGKKSLAGSEVIPNIGSSSTYVLVCDGPLGKAYASATLWLYGNDGVVLSPQVTLKTNLSTPNQILVVPTNLGLKDGSTLVYNFKLEDTQTKSLTIKEMAFSIAGQYNVIDSIRVGEYTSKVTVGNSNNTVISNLNLVIPPGSQGLDIPVYISYSPIDSSKYLLSGSNASVTLSSSKYLNGTSLNTFSIATNESDYRIMTTVGCSVGQTGTYPNCVTPQTPSVKLTANTTSIASGGSVTLTWTSTQMKQCQATSSPNHVNFSGSKFTNSSQTISNLTQTTKFTISCLDDKATFYGDTGTLVSSVDVNVGPAPITPKPTVTLTANPTSVSSGKDTTLSWSSTNATSCTASTNPSNTNWSGSKPISGSQTTPYLWGTTQFTLTCVGAGGETKSTIDVGVLSQPIDTPKSVSINASQTLINGGGSVSLSWTTLGVSGCTASANPSNTQWSGSKATSGNQTISNLTQNTIFTLSCGDVSSSREVKIVGGVSPTTSEFLFIDGCKSYEGFSTTTGKSCFKNDAGLSITPAFAVGYGGKLYYKLFNGNWYSFPNWTPQTLVVKDDYIKACNKYYSGATGVLSGYDLVTIDGYSDLSVYKCIDAKHLAWRTSVLGASTEKNPNLCSLDSTLLKGMKSKEVKCLQQKLNQKGYKVVGTEGGKEHTQFGYYTMLALKKFQAENSLKADGILGIRTRELLNQ